MTAPDKPALIGECARCGADCIVQPRDPRNHEMEVCAKCHSHFIRSFMVEKDVLAGRLAQMEKERDEAVMRRDRVQDLHYRGARGVCVECSAPFPCRTAEAVES